MGEVRGCDDVGEVRGCDEWVKFVVGMMWVKFVVRGCDDGIDFCDGCDVGGCDIVGGGGGGDQILSPHARRGL